MVSIFGSASAAFRGRTRTFVYSLKKKTQKYLYIFDLFFLFDKMATNRDAGTGSEGTHGIMTRSAMAKRSQKELAVGARIFAPVGGVG